MATPDEINRKIQEEINKLTGQTKRNWQDIYNQIDQSNTSVEALQELLERIEDTVESLNDTLEYTAKAFKKIVEQLDKTKAPLQFQDTLISKVSKIARETLEIRKGESFADVSKIKTLQQEVKLNLEQLDNLKESNDLSSEQKDRIQNQINDLRLVGEELNNIIDRDKKLNKELGNTPKIFSSILSGLGMSNNSLTQAYQNTIALGQGAKAAGVKFNTASVFTQQLGSNLKTALGPLTILSFLAKQFVDIFKASDQATGQLAKDFNLTYTQASNLRSELNEVAGLTGDIAVNTKGLQESMVAVGKALGSNAALNEKDLVFMTKMREQAGFANDELVEMQKLTFATGGNLKDNTKSLMFAAKTTSLNNKVLLNEKDIFRDISKTSNAVKLSIVGGAEALGRATAQAKALGMSLDQLNNIASGLLDFESSINAELEAQLLTGRNINLEQARLYAINNDMEGLSKEIAKNYGDASNFSKMNRLQQEALAKAVGMNREELAKTLVDQKALSGLSGKAAEDAKKALAAARAKGMTEEEIAEKSIEDLMKQQSLQDRFNQTVEKLKEIFGGVAQAIMPILDILASSLQVVGLIVAPFASIMDIAGKISPKLRGIVGLLTAAGIAALVLNGSLTFGLGTLAVLAAAGAGISYLKSQTSEATGPAFADGGIVTKPITNATVGEAGPEAIIPLNSSKGKQIFETNQDSVVSELQQIKSILEKQYRLTLSTPPPISLISTQKDNAFNADKQGTAIAVNTYKTQ